ncbi:hypothetical protein ASPZODRAFT_163537 [Penicilliopsis zonata CBS 506.65]|uniref:Uncharacterized protein n=1 Tax=Penicilliopsis zonata CBS 506.65 TaxID=1073090 RepID=A0A1L9SX83_9EURO|nr:hypothetical protein ASPZODRAFT_163537 [Penicilliopsis zonata CBS 506.65]OJJ51747.1 hypothetical protein ASPZODRAFT_163537 [Penicilliopsis zonata CBS 506.65]
MIMKHLGILLLTVTLVAAAILPAGGDAGGALYATNNHVSAFGLVDSLNQTQLPGPSRDLNCSTKRCNKDRDCIGDCTKCSSHECVYKFINDEDVCRRKCQSNADCESPCEYCLVIKEICYTSVNIAHSFPDGYPPKRDILTRDDKPMADLLEADTTLGDDNFPEKHV